MNLMHKYDLYAVNTHFEPKHGETVHTYLLCPKAKKDCTQGDFGFYVGNRVACKYRGKLVRGNVTALVLGDDQDADKWTLKFEDGHILQY